MKHNMKKIILILITLLFPLSATNAITNPVWTGDVLPVIPSGQTQSPYGVGSTTSVSGFVRLYNHIAAVRGLFKHALTIGDVQGVTVNEIAGPPASGFTENDTITYFVYAKIDIGSSAIFSVAPYEFGEISITNTGYSLDLTVDPLVPNATSYRVCRTYNLGSLEYTDIPTGSANLVDRNNPGDPTWTSGCPVTPNSTSVDTYINRNTGSGYWGVESSGPAYFATGLSVGSSTPNPYFSLVSNGSGYFGDRVLSSYFTATSTATSTFIGGIQANILSVSSSTASSTFANGINLTGGCFSINGVCVGGGSGSGTVSSGTYGQLAWYAADGTTVSATGTQLTIGNILTTSTTATSTFKNIIWGNNAGVFDQATGSTTIANLYAGLLTFDTDSGIQTAFDLPIVGASNGVVQSYSFNIDASTTPNLTIYGESNGSGAVKNQRLGSGTTTPSWAFSLVGMSATTATSTFSNGAPGKPSCQQWFSPNGTAYREYITNAGAKVVEAGYCPQ